MKSADLFPTICGHHWLPVFANRPNVNKLSLQIYERLSNTNNPALLRELKARASRDNRKQKAAPSGNGELRTINPDAGLADRPKVKQA